MSKASFICPHCKSNLTLRTSKKESNLFRVAYYQCSNIFCGFTARCEMTLTHQVTPSQQPDPAVNLPRYMESGKNMKV